MYLKYIRNEQLCDFVDKDIKFCETSRASRYDGAALDLMGDLFAGDHSRDDLHYLYEIKEIERNDESAIVRGYAVRVKCPGHNMGDGTVWHGNFCYKFTGYNVKKSGNVSPSVGLTSDFLKFIYKNIPEESKEEFKKFYIDSVVKEAEEFLNC